MMKKLSLIILFFWAKIGFSQGDPVISHGSDVHPAEFVVKINQVIIYDISISYPLLQKINSFIKKRRFYKVHEAINKLGIHSKDGVLVYQLKKGYSIDSSFNIKHE